AGLALAGAGAEAGVALDALDVAESMGDGVADVAGGDVLAGADDRLVGHVASARSGTRSRAASPPAARPDAAAGAPPFPATRPATKSQPSEVRPRSSHVTRKLLDPPSQT